MSYKSAAKKAAFCVMVPAFASSLAMSGAMAQDGADTIEEVVVTGTRREGVSPTETLSPIDLIGGEAIGQQGSFNLTDSLTKVAPSLNTQRFPIADGTAFVRPVTLRNLSPDHTMVLVNGVRRHRSALVNLQLAPLGTVNQGSQGVDFSAFPAAAIKRVEVLRDGASAQYGSDAIAGVVNVILNDASEGFNVSTQYGEYSEGDGERFTISANAGFELGENGFLNATVEHSTSDITSRGTPRPDAQGVAAIVGAGSVDYDGYGQRWGDPDIESDKLFINAGIDLNDSVELYGNASYMKNDTLSGFFYRTPVLPTAANNLAITPRSTLMIDNGIGDGTAGAPDGIADFATAAQVAAITGAGLNPADYLTASAAPSGFSLLNPINTQFPGGYSPKFGAEITDYAFVIGAKGDINDNLSWDVKARFAENEVSYVLEDSINPSLGGLSPTSFKPGTLTQEETGFNADFVKTWDDSPLNMGFGLEWRNETYKIGAGDSASYEAGPTAAIFGVGSDGFQGFAPDTAGSFESDSYAAYIDLETDFTEDWSAAIALRYESYDEFDTTLDWKISSRYQINDQLAVRGTVNTGFRAPTPGQVHTLNVTTTSDSGGNLIPSGTYPVDHPISAALGAEELDTEESFSFTTGFVYEPTDNIMVTVDYYDITIKDRVALSNFTIDAADVVTLTNAGVAGAALLLGSNGNFFVNGFESNISGVDLIVSTEMELGDGMLGIDFRHNYNTQKVSDVKSGSINEGRVYDLENQVPEHSSVLTFNYMQGEFDGLIRFNNYGDWSSTGGLFGPGDATDTTDYSGAVLVDLEARYTFDNKYTLTVGGDNVFDEYPDKEANGTLNYLGQKYAVTSPYGFNGAFWYARISASF
jgi:iron complex outermembrane receptor protein